MSDAELERIEPDPFLARSFLERAKVFWTDGCAELAAESRQVLLHNATIAACDAVLAIDGYRVVGSEGGHQLRLQTAERILGAGHSELFESLDQVRSSRNQVSYGAGFADLLDADDASRHVTRLIGVVQSWVGERLPPWAVGSDDA